MDHRKLINNIIDRYTDFPGVQADIRKVLKYSGSYHRMFVDELVKPSATVEQRLDDIAATVTRPDFPATVDQLRDLCRRSVTDREDNTAAIRDLLSSLKGDPAALKAGFAAADVILAAILDGEMV